MNNTFRKESEDEKKESLYDYMERRRQERAESESLKGYMEQRRQDRISKQNEEQKKNTDTLSSFSKWSDDVTKYFSEWNTERQNRNSSYQKADDIDTYRNENAILRSKYADEALNYINYISENKDNMENTDDTKKWLYSVMTGLEDQKRALDSDYDFWNQFENEDQYNAYTAYNRWNNVDQNEDFEEKSKYVPYERQDNSTAEAIKSISHKWINEGFEGVAATSSAQAAAKAAEAHHYDEFDKILTDDLRKKYNYIYATEGYDAAKKYLYGVLQNSDVKYEWYEILPDAIKEGIGANSFEMLRNKITGDVSDYEMENRNVLRKKEFAQDETLSKIGKTAGSLILTVALSGVAGGIGGAVSGASSAAVSTTLGEGAKLFGTASAKIAENAIKAGLTSAFIQGSRYAIQNAGNAALSGNWKDYLIDTGVTAGIGAAAGSTSALVSDIGMNALAGKVVGGNKQLIPQGSINEMQNILNKHSLINNKWAVAAIGGASGLTYSAIHSGLNEAYNASKNKDYKFNVSDFATEAAIGMLYGFFLNLTKSYTQSPSETVNEYKKEVKYKYFDENMTPEEAAARYKDLAKTNHPDAGGSAETMSEINAEYDVYRQNHAAETASSSFNAMKAAADAGDPVAYQNAAEEFNSAVEVVKNVAQETGSSDIAEIAEALEAISADISSPESFPKTEDIGVLSSMGNNPQYAPAMQEQTESLPFKYKEDPQLSPIWDTILKNAEEGLQRANNVPAAVKPVEKGNRFLKSREVGEVGMAVYDSLINPEGKNPILYQDYVEKVPVDFYGAYFYPNNKENTVLQDWEKEAIHLAAEIDKGEGNEQKLQLLSDLLTEKAIKPQTKEEVQAETKEADFEELVKTIPAEERENAEQAVELAALSGERSKEAFQNIVANRIKTKGDISSESLASLFTAFNNYYEAGKENMELTDVQEKNADKPVNDLLTTQEKESAWLAGNRDVDTSINGQYNVNNERGIENGQGNIHLHNGEQRNAGENSGKRVSGVETEAGVPQEARMVKGRESGIGSEHPEVAQRGVTAIDLGIDGGTADRKVDILKNPSNEIQKEAIKEGKKHGVEVVLFVGDSLSVNGGKINGVIIGDIAYIRGDHDYFTPLQLAKHESFHKIVRGENEDEHIDNILKLWKIFLNSIGDRRAAKILFRYADAYEKSLNDNNDVLYVYEEILADIYAGMNSFYKNKEAKTVIEEALFLSKFYRDMVDAFEKKQKIAKRSSEQKESRELRFSREIDKKYLEAVNKGDMETAQRMVDEAANVALKDSKVRDENGLLKMYHGTKEQFNEFLREKIGSTGRFEGSGFNFTPYEGRAESYGKNVLGGYLNIENPLSAERKTLSVTKLAQIIREADPTGDNIIANYAQNTDDYGSESFIRRESMTTAKAIWSFADNDVDIYSELSSADPDAESLISVFEGMGYDGLIHYDDNGKIKTAVAFSSNQFKKADPVTYDDEGNVIPPSKRFNSSNNDIRFSRELKSEEKRRNGEKLTEKQFYSLYSAHKLDLRGNGNVEAQIQNIKDEGFKGNGGFGTNLMPAHQIVRYPTIDKYNFFKEWEEEGKLEKGYADKYKDEMGDEFGKPVPDNISVAKYGPRKGEWIMLVPRSGAEINKNYDRVKPGYKPMFDYEFVQADYDYQPYYEMYSKAYDAAHATKKPAVQSGEEMTARYEQMDQDEKAARYPVRFSLEMKNEIEEQSMKKAKAQESKGLLPYSTEYLKERNKEINKAIETVRKELFNPKTGNVYTDKNGEPLIPEAVRLAEDGSFIGLNTKSATGGLSNNIFSNGSYLKDAESTTECFRQLVYFAFAEKVSEKLGRPLTEKEAIIANQAAIEIGVEAPCIYCYSLLDRKAREAYKLQYLAERDQFMKQFEKDSGGDREKFKKNLSKNLEKYYQAYVERVLDPSAYDESGKKTKSRKSSNLETRREANHKKGELSDKEKRVRLWMDLYANGIDAINENDVRNWYSDEELKEKYKSINDSTSRKLKLAEIDDIMSWVQGSSQAKIRIPYHAYSNVSRNGKSISGILTWPQTTIDRLNRQFGLRLYSHADFHAAFTIDLMQQIRDASIRGLKGLMYCKPIEAAKICAPTGINTNISCFMMYDEELQTYVCDALMGADWNEVKKLRKKYKNVGAVMVVTSDDQLLWALTQDWIDVVIPLHKVRAGDVFMKEFGLNDYSRYQEDKLTDEEVYDRFVQDKIAAIDNISENQKKAIRKDSKSIFPTEHQNDYETYKKELVKRGLTARFNDILMQAESGNLFYNGIQITPQMYMKLVNETRQAAKDTSVLKPEFDIDEAENAIKSLKEKGYYDYFKPSAMINGKKMNADELAEQVVKDIKAGKNANELGYGRKLNTDFLAGDPTAARARQLGLGGKHDVSTQKTSKEIDSRAFEPATLAEARAEVQRLQKENEKQKQRIEYLEGQMKTSERKMDPKSIDRWVKKIVKDYGRDVDTETLEQSLKDASEIYYRNRDKELTPELEEQIKNALTPAADSIIRNAKVKNDSGEKDYKSLRATLKAGVFISDQDKSNIADFEDWRKRNIGYITISKNGSPIDTLYAELQDEFGRGFFPDGVDTPSDKLQLVVDVIKDMNNIYENPYQSSDMTEVMEHVKNELLTQMYNGVIRETEPTFADKMEMRIQKECEKTAKLIEQAVEKNQKENDQLIAELKKEYKENIKSMLRAQKLQERSDRQRMSENEKLRRLIKRLRNKNLSSMNRARLDEIVGDLATRYIRLTGDKLDDLETLEEFMEENPDIIFPERVQDEVKELKRKHIGDLSQEEVANLIEVLLNFETEVDNANKQIDAEDKRETFRQAVAAIKDIRDSEGTKAGLARDLDDAFVMNTLSPERYAHRITGYRDNDPLANAIYDMTMGEAKMLEHMMQASKIFDRWTEDTKLMRKWQGMFADEITVMGIGPNGSPVEVKITPAMRVSLYLHSLNNENMAHIQDGGIMIPDMKLYKHNKFADAVSEGGKHPVRFTVKDIQRIAAHMTDEEWAFANAVKEYYAGLSKDDINEVSVKLNGFDIAGVENYFPIYTNKNFIRQNFDGMKFDGTIEGMGFLKKRIDSHAPIYLQDVTKVIKRSIESTARYVGLAIPVRNMNKLLGVTSGEFIEKGRYEGDITVYAPTDSLLQAIDEKWGNPGIEYLRNMMRDIQTGTGDMSKILAAYKKIRSNYAGAVLTLNAGVAFKQAASYPTAMAVLGAKPILRAFRYLVYGKIDTDLIAKYTPVQWYRSRGFTTQEIGDITSRGINLPSWLNWIQWVDLKTTRALWKASEFYVQEQMPQFKEGTDLYYEQVARIYNRVIWDTQPNYTFMERPAYLRSNNPLIQTLMMFKTQPFQNFNIIYDAIGNMRAKKGDLDDAILSNDKDAIENAKKNYDAAKKNVGRALMSQVISLVVFAGMTALWAFARRKTDKYKGKDGEENLLTWAAGIGKDVLGGAAGMIPFGSDVWEVLSSVIFNDRYYGYSSAAESAINDILSSIESAASSIKNGKMTAAKWKKLAKDVAQGFGIPAKNIANLFNAILSWFGAEEIF